MESLTKAAQEEEGEGAGDDLPGAGGRGSRSKNASMTYI
jgi:hypothetical protein